MRIESALYEMDFFDIHYHANPDMYVRLYNAVEAGKVLSAYNGCAILKSHLGSTVEVATLAQELGYPVLGSLVLNPTAGGMGEQVILAAIAKYPLAEKIPLLVYFPTHTPVRHVSQLQRTLSHPGLARCAASYLSVSDNGYLKSEVMGIMRLAKDYPIRLATGHATKLEVKLMAEYSAKIGLQHFLVTHPMHPCCGLNAEDIVEYAHIYPHLWFEQTALTCLLGHQTLEDFEFIVKNIPRLIYSSDLGQPDQLSIPEWLQQSTAWFDSFNLQAEQKKKLCLTNAIHFFCGE